MSDPRWKHGLPSNWITRYSQATGTTAQFVQSVSASARNIKTVEPDKYGWDYIGGTKYQKQFGDGAVKLSYSHPNREWSVRIFLFTTHSDIDPRDLSVYGLIATNLLLTNSNERISLPMIGSTPKIHIGIWNTFINAGWRVSAGNEYSFGALTAYWDATAHSYAGGWHIYTELQQKYPPNIDIEILETEVSRLAIRAAGIVQK